MEEKLQVGKIGAPHGIKGEIKVFPLTQGLEIFESLKEVYIKEKEAYKSYTIANTKFQQSNLILKFDEVNDRNAADLLKNKIIEIERKDAPPLKEEEYYIVDLIGLKVYENDQYIGVLQDILQTGAADIYSIKSDEKEILVPAIAEYILKIDINNNRILVNIPEGLKEL